MSPAPLVLVVDDYLDSREMYADYLQFTGYRVLEAASGTEALELAQARHPDLVLMDLSLPGMDGWEATRRLKADPRTRRIAVLALTGHVLPRHAQAALEAGCDGFLPKPCLPETMLAAIRRTLAGRATQEPE